MIRLPCCGRHHESDGPAKTGCKIKEARFDVLQRANGETYATLEFELEGDPAAVGSGGLMYLDNGQLVQIVHELRTGAGFKVDRTERRRIVHRLRVLRDKIERVKMSEAKTEALVFVSAFIDKTRSGT